MRFSMIVGMFIAAITANAQVSIVGTWQLTAQTPCIAQQMEESDTEKELLQSFGSSSSAVAKLIRFDPKGKGEEGIFKTGRKKGGDMEPFRYQLSGDELQFLDKKSGIIEERFVIDELSSVELKFHRVGRDCESLSFRRVK